MRSRDARVAGLLYFVSIIIGLFTLMYVPGKLIVRNDAAATANNIIANESLFRLAMLGDLLGGVVWLFVVLALYRLLKDVDGVQAVLMVILGALLQVPLYFVNVVNYAAAWLLVSGGAAYLSAFSIAQRDALAMVFLRLHYYQLLSSLMFAGLWLFPFGILVWKSRFLPRILGAWLLVNGCAWLAICLSGFAAPAYADRVYAIASPILPGEMAIMFWLLVFGTKPVRFSRVVANTGD